MHYVLRYSIMMVAILFLVPLLAWGAEGNLKEEKNVVPAPGQDIKKAAKPIVANIPEKFNDLTKTFSEYWSAMKKRDYQKAYELEGSDYKKVTGFDLYKERLKDAVEIIAVRPLEVKPINEKEVMVRASLGFKMGFIDTLRFFDDHWVKEADGWRHLPEEEKKG